MWLIIRPIKLRIALWRQSIVLTDSKIECFGSLDPMWNFRSPLQSKTRNFVSYIFLLLTIEGDGRLSTTSIYMTSRCVGDPTIYLLGNTEEHLPSLLTIFVDREIIEENFGSLRWDSHPVYLTLLAKCYCDVVSDKTIEISTKRNWGKRGKSHLLPPLPVRRYPIVSVSPGANQKNSFLDRIYNAEFANVQECTWIYKKLI